MSEPVTGNPPISKDYLFTGLDDAEAGRRLARFGPNTLPRPPRRSAWLILAGQFSNFIVLLLLASSAVAALLGEFGQSVAILAALGINAGVGFAMDFQAERIIASLQDLVLPVARVRRDGRELELPASQLVPGDVVLLEAGDRVPADAQVVEGECRVDESLLTGESLPRLKRAGHGGTATDEAGDPLFAGTVLTRGSVVAIVTATGAGTELGRIGRMLGEARRPPSPIDERLADLGRFLLWTILALSALILAIGLWQGRPLGVLVSTALALAIAAIPEGLPSVATLAMAAGVRRLERFGLRVRHLPALEALGGVTTLCLDKTGTLTLNAMTVERIELPGRSLEVTGEGWAPAGDIREGCVPVDARSEPALQALLQAGQLCNEAAWERDDESGWHIHGDPSEGALLVVAAKAGLDDPRGERPVRRAWLPEPDRPWMAVVREDGPALRAYMKGAPEQVLAHCETVLEGQEERPLGPQGREEWQRSGHDLARRGLRVFALADCAAYPGEEERILEGGWRFLGLIAMRDPPRADAREMLREAHRAGIRTVMITGDHPSTAGAIATDLDLANGRPPRVGTDVDAGADLDVYARATPEGKLKLVRALQERGEVVAMTGDGVNDAPALRAAIVGVAMGRGTDVARDAATVVLVDESLSTLLAGIREGRGAFLNIQKSVDYLLTCSMATMLVVLLASSVGLPLPLNPLQILYLNLLMHTFPALGLALEPASQAVLRRPPLPRQAWLLPSTRMFLILWHGLIITVATLAVAAWGTGHESVAHGQTLAFTTLAVSLLVHALADRAEAPFGGWSWKRGSPLPSFLAAALGMFLCALFVPGLSSILGSTRLEREDWLAVIVAASVGALAVETSKVALHGRQSEH